MQTNSNIADPQKMRLLITHEAHTIQGGEEYYNKQISDYKFMLNYLHLFPQGDIIMRCEGKVDAPQEQWLQISGERINVIPIPEYGSLKSMLKTLPTIYSTVKRATKRTDRSIVRLPGICGLPVAMCLWLQGKKYGVEFVGHATESVVEQYRKQGKKPGLTVKLLEWSTHFFVRRAVAVGYRSEYLRRTYPHGNPEREIIFSGAQLNEKVITAARSREHFDRDVIILTYTGRLMAEKGCHILLEAFAIAAQKSTRQLKLRLIGDGAMSDDLKSRAKELEIDSQVEFPGRVPWGDQLFTLLDDAHLFVLPSLTEGMPRSLIEAMSRGMPAIGSNCGGIPELLEPENLVEPGNINALAGKILQLVDNPNKLASMSHENFEASKQHWPDNLNRQKDKFWNLVLKYG